MVNIRGWWRFTLLLVFLVVLTACTQGEALQPTTSASDNETERSFALLTDIPIPPPAEISSAD